MPKIGIQCFYGDKAVTFPCELVALHKKTRDTCVVIDTFTMKDDTSYYDFRNWEDRNRNKVYDLENGVCRYPFDRYACRLTSKAVEVEIGHSYAQEFIRRTFEKVINMHGQPKEAGEVTLWNKVEEKEPNHHYRARSRTPPPLKYEFDDAGLDTPYHKRTLIQGHYETRAEFRARVLASDGGWFGEGRYV